MPKLIPYYTQISPETYLNVALQNKSRIPHFMEGYSKDTLYACFQKLSGDTIRPGEFLQIVIPVLPDPVREIKKRGLHQTPSGWGPGKGQLTGSSRPGIAQIE